MFGKENERSLLCFSAISLYMITGHCTTNTTNATITLKSIQRCVVIVVTDDWQKQFSLFLVFFDPFKYKLIKAHSYIC